VARPICPPPPPHTHTHTQFQLWAPDRPRTPWTLCPPDAALHCAAKQVITIVHARLLGQMPPMDFFETSAMLISLLLLGKFLESSAKGRTSDALTKLMNLTPDMATVRCGAGQWMRCPAVRGAPWVGF
jgi:hypothetical protein